MSLIPRSSRCSIPRVPTTSATGHENHREPGTAGSQDPWRRRGDRYHSAIAHAATDPALQDFFGGDNFRGRGCFPE